MTFLFQVTLLLPIIFTCASFCRASLNVTYGWKYIEYVRESCIDQEEYSIVIESYDYTKNVPHDIQPLPDGRILVTTPRYFNNPASLSTISDQTGDGGPLLAPYPDWSWHNRKDCSGITSVNRVFLDDCNRLWVVDSGKIGNYQVCPAQILAFDPENDELMIQLIIPNELTHNANNQSQGRLEVAGVETHGNSCKKTWVYIADPEGYGLVIWDGYDIWRLNDEIFNPDPSHTNFSIAGENFTLNIGLSNFYMTPKGYLKINGVIFKPLTSLNLYAANYKDLHNSKSGSDIPFYMLDLPAPSYETAGGYSKKGGILMGSFSTETVIACWNIQYPMEDQYIANLIANETTLQFVSAMKFTEDSERGSQTVWTLTTRFQRFLLGTMDFDEINFRILTGDVDTLVRGTVCEPPAVYDVALDLEEKLFFFYKTATDDLFASYPLRYDTDNLVNRPMYKSLEQCDVENGIEDKEFLYYESPINAHSKGCSLIKKMNFPLFVYNDVQ